MNKLQEEILIEVSTGVETHHNALVTLHMNRVIACGENRTALSFANKRVVVLLENHF